MSVVEEQTNPPAWLLFDRVHEAAKSNAPIPHFPCTVRGVEASKEGV